MTKFDAKNYWENRLKNNYGLHGVGRIGLGVNYNNWQYKVRRQVFLKHIPKIIPNIQEASVLDIGSGTGFYIERWKELQAKKITGSDITDVAIEKLRSKYSDTAFFSLDIGAYIDKPEMENNFDVISAFDVLFHIVDDLRYKQAFVNIHRMLKPGGYFVFSDNFLHRAAVRQQHIVWRSLEEICEIVEDSGFEIVTRKPMFFFMNYPSDSENRLLIRSWHLMQRFIRMHECSGWLCGAILYPLESLLLSVKKESPASEMMVCRKK